jgi:hypothetical protein
MIQKFIVYTKKGAVLTVEMKSFEVQGDKFVLVDEAGKVSSEGFLSFDAIAAIVPHTQKDKNTLCFNVHLKGKGQVAQVHAGAFDMSDSKSVKFTYRQYDMMGSVANEWPVENIYVALSEVVCIIPDDGLKYRDR